MFINLFETSFSVSARTQHILNNRLGLGGSERLRKSTTLNSLNIIKTLKDTNITQVSAV